MAEKMNQGHAHSLPHFSCEEALSFITQQMEYDKSELVESGQF